MANEPPGDSNDLISCPWCGKDIDESLAEDGEVACPHCGFVYGIGDVPEPKQADTREWPLSRREKVLHRVLTDAMAILAITAFALCNQPQTIGLRPASIVAAAIALLFLQWPRRREPSLGGGLNLRLGIAMFLIVLALTPMLLATYLSCVRMLVWVLALLTMAVLAYVGGSELPRCRMGVKQPFPRARLLIRSVFLALCLALVALVWLPGGAGRAETITDRSDAALIRCSLTLAPSMLWPIWESRDDDEWVRSPQSLAALLDHGLLKSGKLAPALISAAIYEGNAEVVRTLIDRGVVPTVTGYYGRVTPFRLATERGNWEVLGVLREWYASRAAEDSPAPSAPEDSSLRSE